MIPSENDELIICGYNSGAPSSIALDDSDTFFTLGHSWGFAENVPMTSDSITYNGTVYTFTQLANVTAFKCSEFEVVDTSYNRPFASSVTQMLVLVGVEVGFDGRVEYGEQVNPYSNLLINTPTSEAPADTYNVYLWIDWSSAEQSSGYSPGDGVQVSYPSGAGDPIPSDAVWSFGNLIDF